MSRFTYTLQFQKMSENASTPVKGSKHSAGYDLSAAECKVIPAGDRTVIFTDIRICMPLGTYGRIAPRSGFSYDFNCHIGGGVVGNIFYPKNIFLYFCIKIFFRSTLIILAISAS